MSHAFRPVSRTFNDRDSDDITCRMVIEGRCSIGDLMDHLRVRVPDGVTIDDITISGMVIWPDTATPVEKGRRKKKWAEHDARLEEYERKTYARLKEKFGDG